ncbi:MAG: hypothetical protein WB524_20225 [Acidobacteriaceae bacterium]
MLLFDTIQPMKARGTTFVALSAMFFAVLTIAHADFYYTDPFGLPWFVALAGVRLVLSCFLAWGLTVILFHFRR